MTSPDEILDVVNDDEDEILEVDPIAAKDDRIIETHPEVCFRAMKGEPLAYSKKTWNGQGERRSLIADAGIDLPQHLPDAGKVPPDDVLDAAAADPTREAYQEAYLPLLLRVLRPNVSLDTRLTEKELENRLNNISLTRGSVDEVRTRVARKQIFCMTKLSIDEIGNWSGVAGEAAETRVTSPDSTRTVTVSGSETPWSVASPGAAGCRLPPPSSSPAIHGRRAFAGRPPTA